MVIVTYINGGASVDPGVKGTYVAPTNDIEKAIAETKLVLVEGAIEDGVDGDIDPVQLFSIVKAEVVASVGNWTGVPKAGF